MRNLIAVALLAVLGMLVYFYLAQKDPETDSGSGRASSGRSIEVAVVVPNLQGTAAVGEKVFNAKCVACHGKNAGGVDGAGPPFIHKIYEPSHHGDQAFALAARQGVRSHHWPFGDMPPVEGITDAEIAAVIEYVRVLQSENGIR